LARVPVSSRSAVKSVAKDRAALVDLVTGAPEIQFFFTDINYTLVRDDHECGSIYGKTAPKVHMCGPPLVWQSYDITFHSARRGADGKKAANARITVVHNGVVIHDNFELPHATPGGIDEKEGEPAGLLLQDHGNPVQFRNIWVKRL